MTRRKMFAAAGAMALSMVAATADAEVRVSGTGVWNPTSPTTPFMAPAGLFNFSFDVPDAFPSTGPMATTSNISNYSYTLNGKPVTLMPTSVTFYSTANFGGGMFDLTYGTTNLFGALGADIGSDGTVGPDGPYPVSFGDTYGSTSAGGVGTVTVSTVNAVPEPATWLLMVGGIGVTGYAMRRRQKVAVSYAA